MPKVNITKQCEAKISFSGDGALVYLYHNETPVGLFDEYGFHFMVGNNDRYSIKDGFKACNGIIWFKVYESK